MIYTCTLNPSVDYQIDTKQLELGTLNRVENTAFYPGGKGINVSRVLNNLDVESTALGFIGGFTGTFILEKLHDEGIKTDFAIHDEPTRINMKIKTAREETEVNGNGAYINKEIQAQLIQKIKSLNSNDYLVLSGSIPSSISIDIYNTISSICSENGVSLIIDIPNRSLKDLLTYRPFLIKPNQREISQILDREVNTKQDAIKGAKELVQLGAQNVIVSMGGEGAIFINESQIVTAEVPPGKLKSSVGAGDSLVGGFLASYFKEKDYRKAFLYGVASGSATAFSSDLCEREEVEQLISDVLLTI
ncbi:1-phosphofructokinase [Virgibacillus profundi]|uniref:Tagatose-6-phosphate kinase n=1 Tax=Virgibacillus profundi TaxID=2024555 RepID=A0A2A2I8E2_9BACI|nr:1-phosphofructokinase [Virgibacillus profundi]PAV27658.1 1-phosphofructokinase [Virgibacillus profundi]PXY51988.1 1-phosphofructokinase [Virgibacillus profundi]